LRDAARRPHGAHFDRLHHILRKQRDEVAGLDLLCDHIPGQHRDANSGERCRVQDSRLFATSLTRDAGGAKLVSLPGSPNGQWFWPDA
jgi:hypothetical protein